MASTNGHQAAHVTVEGVVEARNERGLKLDGDWINLSKFRPLELPDAGARVRAQVDNRGYLCSVEILEPSSTPAVSSRNETITRLAVLKAAAEFGASRPDLKSSEVLMIADKWLAWVEQNDG